MTVTPSLFICLNFSLTNLAWVTFHYPDVAKLIIWKIFIRKL